MKQQILVVDDHKENLIALEAILESPNRRLIMANNGNEALQLALKHDIALILLDVQMPDMDGFEVAQLLRQGRKTKSIPIIFVTAISKEQSYVFKGYECGAVDYMFKPIDPQVLTAKVDVFLELDLQKRKLQQAVVQMKRLKDENERLLQALGEPVVGVDAKGRITFANPALAALMQREREQLVGQPVEQVLFLKASGKPRWSWEKSPVATACRAGEVWKTETPLAVLVGENTLSLDITASPLNQPGENFSGVAMVLRDMTDSYVDIEEQQAREARRYRRKKLSQELVAFDRNTGANVGRILNLSIDGFKMFMRQPCEPGTALSLSSVLPSQVQGVSTLSLDASCIWSKPLETEGEFHVGFQITNVSDLHRKVLAALMENGE